MSMETREVERRLGEKNALPALSVSPVCLTVCLSVSVYLSVCQSVCWLLVVHLTSWRDVSEALVTSCFVTHDACPRLPSLVKLPLCFGWH